MVRAGESGGDASCCMGGQWLHGGGCFVPLGLCIIRVYHFFFQAEDGIRDHCVTGVQTCALPISSPGPPFSGMSPQGMLAAQVTATPDPVTQHRATVRSEERRVGKECRSGWLPDELKEKVKGD